MVQTFCGWMGESGTAPQDESIVRRMLADDPHATTAPPVATDCGPRHALAVSAGGSLARADDGRLALVVGRTRWRDSGIDRLSAERGAGHAVLAALQSHGADTLLDAVRGEFAIAMLDPRNATLLLATDWMGMHPVYYAQVDGGIVFGSRLGSVARHPRFTPQIDAQALYDYLYFHCIPSPRTIYRGAAKLRPAERIDYAQGRVTTRTYWLPDREGAPADSDFPALQEELRHTLEQAVRERAQGPAAECGAFLSGGLDSSTVAGYLNQTLGRARTYSIGFNDPSYDESAYARTTARHFGTDHREYFVTPQDVLASVPNIAAYYDEPFGNSSAVPAYHCARFAVESGSRLLLAGDGGDELFAGNERYATQEVFEYYGRVPRPLRSALEGAYARVPALRDLPLARKGYRYIVQAQMPLPDRLQSYNFMVNFAPDAVLQPALLAQIDTGEPIRALRRRYFEADTQSALNRMLYLDWKFTLADNDLVKVNGMCALAGIDVSYPMLDDRLVELSWRLPAAWKMPNRRLRDFYKKALAGFLAPATIHKTKHGFGLPFGTWLRDDAPLQALAQDALASLKNRQLLQPAFIDQALHLHGSDTARYYGELVWLLLMLELWLQHHRT